MDPAKCLEILHARSAKVDPEKEEFYKSLTSNGSEVSAAQPSAIDVISLMDNITLMNLFTTIQGERVQVLTNGLCPEILYHETDFTHNFDETRTQT